jgi:Domain of unknown function (DUF4332)
MQSVVKTEKESPMPSTYHLDLNTFPLEKFQHILETKDLIPSRVGLKEDLADHFAVLRAHGITSMQDLINALKNKDKLKQFAQASGLPADYLTLLKREAGSYLRSPVRLDKLPGVSAAAVDALEEQGIKNTRNLFDRAQTAEQRGTICQATGIPAANLLELVCLSDLSRAYGVGPVFARMLYDVSVHSIQDFVNHSAEEIIAIYEKQTGKKADFSIGEIEFSLELAKALEIAVEL